MKNKILADIEFKMETLDKSSFRYQILDAAKRFKTNWLELAKYLYQVQEQKIFKEWGYLTFDLFCAKEIGIKKQTALKLLRSYNFLACEEPHFLGPESLGARTPAQLPGYESIDVLRMAKRNKDLKPEDYNQLKERTLEQAAEPKEIGRQFRSMLWAVKNANPEEERASRRRITIKRLLSTLKSLRKETELLNILPDKIIKDTASLILSLEKEL